MKNIKHKLTNKSYNGEQIYVQCCVCSQYKGDDGKWYTATEEHNELISHTYCPPCLSIAIEELKRKRGEGEK